MNFMEKLVSVSFKASASEFWIDKYAKNLSFVCFLLLIHILVSEATHYLSKKKNAKNLSLRVPTKN